MSTEGNASTEPPTSRVDRRQLARLLATIALAAVLIMGGWFSLVYALDTSNPILVVEGNSMHPTLEEGDLVILQGATLQEVAKDFNMGSRDIIVFFSDRWDRYIVHRVKGVASDQEGNVVGLFTQGDNNPTADRTVVREDDLVGKVVSRIPSLGHGVIFFRSPTGIALLSILIVLLVVWSTLDEVKTKRKTNQ